MVCRGEFLEFNNVLVLSAHCEVELPDGDGGADGHVERVLGALLGYFEADVGGIDNALVDAVDLVTGDYGIAPRRLRLESVERHAAVYLLQGADGVAFCAQALDGLHGLGVIFPAHRLFGAEGGLVDFGRGGRGGDAAQADLFDTKCIGGAEHRPYVVEAAHIVENHHKGDLPLAAKLFDGVAPHFPDCFFLH